MNFSPGVQAGAVLSGGHRRARRRGGRTAVSQSRSRFLVRVCQRVRARPSVSMTLPMATLEMGPSGGLAARPCGPAFAQDTICPLNRSDSAS